MDWMLADRGVTELIARLDGISVRLAAFVGGTVGRGIVSGLNEAFYIDGSTRDALIAVDPRNTEVIKPLAVGDDIRSYHVRSGDRWLIYVPHGVEIDRYPAIVSHLNQYRDRLERRATAASHAWYQLQQPQAAYQSFFEGAKIVYPEISRDRRFAFHPGPLYPNNKCFFIPGVDFYLLAILNSRIIFFVLQNRAAQLEGPSAESRYFELRAQYIEKLPIRRIEPTTPEPTKRELSAWLVSLYHKGLRRAGVEPDVPEDIRALGVRLGELQGIERVVLIGSWARGDAGPDSDVDLLVVDAPDGDPAQRYAEVRRHLGRHARPIDVLLVTPADFALQVRERRSFVGQALEEGVVLHGA